MARRGNAAADKRDRNALAFPLACHFSGQLLLGLLMRAPIKGAIAFFMREQAGRRRKRFDWALLLGWAGIAIALWILLAIR